MKKPVFYCSVGLFLGSLFSLGYSFLTLNWNGYVFCFVVAFGAAVNAVCAYFWEEDKTRCLTSPGLHSYIYKVYRYDGLPPIIVSKIGSTVEYADWQMAEDFRDHDEDWVTCELMFTESLSML